MTTARQVTVRLGRSWIGKAVSVRWGRECLGTAGYGVSGSGSARQSRLGLFGCGRFGFGMAVVVGHVAVWQRSSRQGLAVGSAVMSWPVTVLARCAQSRPGQAWLVGVSYE